MTKIKDLVDVAVDNAFMLFPIDNERYELIAAVREFAGKPNGFLRGSLTTSDWRICGFLKKTEDTFHKADIAVQKVSGGSPVSEAVHDLYARTMSPIYAYMNIFDLETLPDILLADVTPILWYVFFCRLEAADALLNSVSKGRRLST